MYVVYAHTVSKTIQNINIRLVTRALEELQSLKEVLTCLKESVASLTHQLEAIKESVDSLCRDGADTPIVRVHTKAF